VLERTNARSLRPQDLPYRPDLVVADLSFISLARCCRAAGLCGRAIRRRRDGQAAVRGRARRVGKGGVVRDEADRRAAVVAVAACARELGATVLGAVPSGVPGPKGNRETFLWLGQAGREGGVADLETALRDVPGL
jgi:23S rRNA (cytidine1920-2'-O)/16S rRNA (cytidine1409-2'-O)-methyltransferase